MISYLKEFWMIVFQTLEILSFNKSWLNNYVRSSFKLKKYY